MAESTFIDHFMEHTKDYESPSSFWKWAALTAIAGSMRDNCYRRLGDQKLYPNIYTILLADSAVHRKGQPVQLCEKLVSATKSTKTISGRSSIQAILDELSRGETDKQTGKLSAGGSALFSAPELSAGIVNDPEAIKILTDIYDFKEEYTSRLRGSGVFRIKNVCFSVMGASNEELMKDVYDTKALFGGLLGRTFLVKPDEFRPGNSLFDIRDTSDSFGVLCEKLLRISKIKGEFEFTPDAKLMYEEWYLPFRKSYENKADRSGISGRIHTSVLKVAMILCVNQTLKLTVGCCHIQEAIRICTKLMPNYTGFIMSTGKAAASEIIAQLIEDIWTANGKTLSKQDFLQRYFHRFDLENVDKAIATAEQAGLIKAELDTRNGEFSYTVTEKSQEVFKLR